MVLGACEVQLSEWLYCWKIYYFLGKLGATLIEKLGE